MIARESSRWTSSITGMRSVLKTRASIKQTWPILRMSVRIFTNACEIHIKSPENDGESHLPTFIGNITTDYPCVWARPTILQKAGYAVDHCNILHKFQFRQVENAVNRNYLWNNMEWNKPQNIFVVVQGTFTSFIFRSYLWGIQNRSCVFSLRPFFFYKEINFKLQDTTQTILISRCTTRWWENDCLTWTLKIITTF